MNMDDHEVITALYPHDVELDALLQSLRDSGVSDAQVAVLTPLPLVERASARIGAVPLYAVTIVAGLVGIGVGLFFAGGTAALYPLMTGGKPIIAAPIVGIIAYETMMLLAIVTTFVAMIVAIRRSHRGVGARDPRIDDGSMAVALSTPTDPAQVTMIRALLQRAGPLEIRSGRASSEAPGGEASGHAVAVSLAALCLVSGCSRDMQEQPSYQPQEMPRLHSPIGAVPRDSRRVLASHPQEEAVGEGAGLFRVNCSHCHGATGMGDGPVSFYLKEKPANLHRPEVQKLSEATLYEIVTNGKGLMPPFNGELSATERRAVAAYVKSLPPQ